MLCTKVIKKSESVLDLQENILDIVDIIAQCIRPIESDRLELLKGNVIDVKDAHDKADTYPRT